MATPTNKPVTITGATDPKDRRPASIARGGITAQSIFAWGFLFAGLVILADFPGAGEVAAAFALLILISVLLGFGPAAFDNISTLFSGA